MTMIPGHVRGTPCAQLHTRAPHQLCILRILVLGKTPHSQGEFVVSCFYFRGTLKMATLLLYNGFFITNTSFYSVPNQSGNFSDLVEGS